MQIAINPNVYIPAQTFAQQQGLNLTSVIENFLIRFVRENKQATGYDCLRISCDVVLTYIIHTPVFTASRS